MSKKNGHCIFCGCYGLLTREHIWADWLSGHISKDFKNYRAGQLLIGRDGSTAHERSRTIGGDPRSKRVRCVCHSLTYENNRTGCNDGWMKNIQDQSKPFIVPMLKGEDASLNLRQQKLLAGWIAMSVICGEYGDQDFVSIRQKDRTHLFNSLVPPSENWKIWLGHYRQSSDRPLWTHHALRITKEQTKTSTASARPYNTQSTTYSVGEIFIHAISSSISRCVRDFRFASSASAILSQIWPVGYKTTIHWPPRRLLSDTQAHEISVSFFNSIRRAA